MFRTIGFWLLTSSLAGMIMAGCASYDPKILLWSVVAVMACMCLLANSKVLGFILPIVVVLWKPLLSISWSGYSLNLTLMDLLISLLWLKCLFSCANHRGVSFPWKFVFLGLAFLIPASIGSITFRSTASNLALGVLLYWKRFGCYLIMPAIMDHWDNSDIKVCLYGCLVAGLIMCLSSTVGVDQRTVGLAFNPNVLGTLSVLFMNISLGALFFRRRDRPLTMLACFTALVSLVALMRSGSREALVGYILSLFLWYVWGTSRKRNAKKTRFLKYWPLILLLVFLATVLFGRDANVMSQRLTGLLTNGVTGDANARGRLVSTSQGIRLWLSHPFGIGIGNLQYYGPNHVLGLYIYNFTTTDNQFVDMLIEAGPIGLCCFAIWLIYVSKHTHVSDGFVYATYASILALCAIGVFGYTFYNPFVSALFCLLVGMTWRYSSLPHSVDSLAVRKKDPGLLQRDSQF